MPPSPGAVTVETPPEQPPPSIELPAKATRWQRFLFRLRRLLLWLVRIIDQRLGT